MIIFSCLDTLKKTFFWVLFFSWIKVWQSEYENKWLPRTSLRESGFREINRTYGHSLRKEETRAQRTRKTIIKGEGKEEEMSRGNEEEGIGGIMERMKKIIENNE